MNKKILYMPKLEPYKKHHYMPISLLSVASPMVANGENVAIFDERVDDFDVFTKMVKDVESVMFSCYTGYQVTRGFTVSKWLKENYPEIKIIWGGPHASLLTQQTLASPYVDEVICGDVDDGKNPIPWHLVDIEKYVNPATGRFIYISSYSCPGSCTFCSTVPKRKLLFLPLEKVAQDINNLMAIDPFREIDPFRQAVFFDATLFSRPGRAYFISGQMEKHNLSWICDSRADEICRIPDGMLDKIMNSRLQQLTIGLESGSPKIVELMKKGKNHLKYFRQAAERLKKFPVKLVSGVIFGCPSETIEDLHLTIDYIKEIKAINPNFFVSSTFYRPLPGTEMAKMCEEYGYREPTSLSEWAELGEKNHYQYNEYQPSPWIKDSEKYREVYESFKKDNEGLFV